DPQWKMGVEGVFLRESVLEVPMVENLYATPKAFNYLITRLSGEDWYKEQEADGNGLHAVSREQVIADMLRNEKARYAPARLNDLQLCEIIDNQYVTKYHAYSVYHLTDFQKNEIANELYRRHHAGVAQIRRCLVM
ncbi:MAG: hypothetical protein II548_06170, partial [Bacteroidales bacterium]|nr:hypothetical protein [Bacteroidales bacterium]